VADDGPGFRLRLRHADRFVPSLLRDHLVEVCEHIGVYKVRMLDITAPPPETTMSSRPLAAAEGFPPLTPDGKAAWGHVLLASRDGLLLVRTTDSRVSQSHRGELGELRVCDPATGRSRTLPA